MVPYDAVDLSLLLVTRMFAALRIDRARYRGFLGADLLDHHGPVVRAVVEAGLATLDDEAFALTPEGTWFADAVAGTFAEARAHELRDAGAGTRTTDLASGEVTTMFMG